jgi:hypothetical protein
MTMTVSKLFERMCQVVAFAYLDGLCDLELEDDDQLFADLTRAERADLQTEAVRETFREFAVEAIRANQLAAPSRRFSTSTAPWNLKTSVAKTTATNDLRLRRDC